MFPLKNLARKGLNHLPMNGDNSDITEDNIQNSFVNEDIWILGYSSLNILFQSHWWIRSWLGTKREIN